jgi:hypothetical protein
VVQGRTIVASCELVERIKSLAHFYCLAICVVLNSRIDEGTVVIVLASLSSHWLHFELCDRHLFVLGPYSAMELVQRHTSQTLSETGKEVIDELRICPL